MKIKLIKQKLKVIIKAIISKKKIIIKITKLIIIKITINQIIIKIRKELANLNQQKK